MAIQAPTATPPPVKPVEAPSYKPGMATSTGYQAAPYKVEPQGLVQHQLKGIVAEDSPLMQQAARISDQKMNDRGLRNSSIAVGAGHQAVIAEAMPIAQADAATYDRAMTNTANQENAARQFGAAADNTVRLSNQAATNEALKSQQQGTIALTDRKMTNDAQIALANLDAKTKLQITAMDNNTRSLLQTNQSASNAYVQMITNVNQIQNNKEMGAAAKQTAIDNQLALFRQQMRALGSIDSATAQATDDVRSLDLGGYFWQGATPPTSGATIQPIPKVGTPAPEHGAGAYTYTKDGATWLYRPGQPVVKVPVGGKVPVTPRTPDYLRQIPVESTYPGGTTPLFGPLTPTTGGIPAGYYRDERGQLRPK